MKAEARLRVGAAEIDVLTLEETTQLVIERAQAGGPPGYIVTPNAQHVALLESSAELREAYEHAWLSVADGVPLIWASRLLGVPLPGRVNGTDLFEVTCAAAAESGVSVFLFGGKPGSAEGAVRVLSERHPTLRVAGTYCPPMGFERNADERRKAVEAVRQAAAGVVFVGLGAPKQERWMLESQEEIGAPVSMGIGGSFELVSGMVPRAPVWMQRHGLEWFYRLAREPRRLWKRYAVTNPHVVAIVRRQRLRPG